MRRMGTFAGSWEFSLFPCTLNPDLPGPCPSFPGLSPELVTGRGQGLWYLNGVLTMQKRSDQTVCGW